jgi:hypothetical protein
MAPDRDVARTLRVSGRFSVGGVLSATVTSNEPLAELPALSVALHCTAVVPRANVLPEAGLQLGVTAPSTASRAETSNLTVAPEGPVASTVRLDGTLIVGGVVSRTITEKLSLA